MALRKVTGRRRRLPRCHLQHLLESLELRRLLSAPNGPYGLAANVTSATQVQLVFFDNASDETGFVVQRADVAAGPFTTIEQLAPSDGVGKTVFTVDDTVQGGHTYYYQVFAVTGEIGSSIAGPVGITIPTQITTGAGGSVQPVSMPNGPYGLKIDGLGSTSVQLSFVDNADNEAGFVLERSPAGANAFAAIATIALSPGAGQHVSYTDTTAQPGTGYDYRVYAVNGPYQSSIAGPVTATTTGAPAAPDSPFVTSVDVFGTQAQGVVQVAVLFNDNSSNETGFSIQRANSSDGPFVEVGTLPPGVGLAGFHQVFYDASVDLATTYYYRVLAFNGPSFSLPSNVKFVTTPGVPPNPGSAPNGPYGLSAVRNAQGQPQLFFYDNADNETGFVLQRADAAAGPFSTVQNLFPSPGVGQLYTTTDTSAVAGKAYYYRVFAVNGPYTSSIAGPAALASSNGGGNGGNSIGSVQPVSMPNGPYGLRIEEAAANAVAISFINNADNAAGFVAERSLAGANAFSVINAGAFSATVGQRVFYTDTTVQPSTAYDYRVYAVNGPYQSSIAGPVSVTTPATGTIATGGSSGTLTISGGGGSGGGSSIIVNGPNIGPGSGGAIVGLGGRGTLMQTGTNYAYLNLGAGSGTIVQVNPFLPGTGASNLNSGGLTIDDGTRNLFRGGLTVLNGSGTTSLNSLATLNLANVTIAARLNDQKLFLGPGTLKNGILYANSGARYSLALGTDGVYTATQLPPVAAPDESLSIVAPPLAVAP
jgi:hypothetical protein